MEDENFLENSIGNFKDCINNAIYNLQKYIDKFYYPTTSLYLNNEISTDKNVRLLIQFIIQENEEIVKDKGISFHVELNQLLIQKYENFITSIEQANDDFKYLVSEEAYHYLEDAQDEFNWKVIKINSFKRHEEDIDDLLNFYNYTRTILKFYEEIQFCYAEKKYNKKELITLLNMGFTKLTVSMLHLKSLAEGSQDLYMTSISCRTIIKLLILTYRVLETIKIA